MLETWSILVRKYILVISKDKVTGMKVKPYTIQTFQVQESITKVQTACESKSKH